MGDATIHDAPDLSAVLAAKDPWHRAQRSFAAMRPSLLETHRGQYVAVHDGQVVASGADKVDVALEAYRRIGYGPLHVGLVTLEPRHPVRMPYFRPLTSDDEHASWQRFGQDQLARAYGPDEPEYTVADL